MLLVSKKKKPDLEQYRKPRRIAGIPLRLAKQVEILAEKNESDFTEEVRRLVREGLAREGLWPPGGKSPDADE